MSEVDGALIGHHRNRQQRIVTDDGCEVDSIEQVAYKASHIAHVGPVLCERNVPINLGLHPHGTVAGGRLIVLRTVEGDGKRIIARQQVGIQQNNRGEEVKERVDGGVEPRAVEEKIVVAQGVGRSRHTAVVVDLNRQGRIKASSLCGVIDHEGQKAPKEIRCARTQVGVVGRWKYAGEETQPSFNDAGCDHGAGVHEVLNGEHPVDALVEHLGPNITRVVGSDGKLEVASQPGR